MCEQKGGRDGGREDKLREEGHGVRSAGKTTQSEAG